MYSTPGGRRAKEKKKIFPVTYKITQMLADDYKRLSSRPRKREEERGLFAELNAQGRCAGGLNYIA